jgi:hypothetical protein
MKDIRYIMLVLIHELIEYFLCLLRGIKEEDITAFDKMYEKEREQGLHKPDEECGDDKRAPYYKEHQFATKIEMLLSREMGVSWARYSKTIEEL